MSLEDIYKEVRTPFLFVYINKIKGIGGTFMSNRRKPKDFSELQFTDDFMFENFQN